jgi:carbon starvation protein
MLPISFGSMLLESLLAIIALVTVGALATNGVMPKGTPPQIFAQAVAGFLTKLGLPENVIFTLITLAVSAFALTSLDSVARVGRMAFQELFTEDGLDHLPVLKFLSNKFVATILTLILGYLLSIIGYANIWPLFGSANQLLAALSLIACAVFLKKTKRQGAMLWVPMVLMLAVTFTALVMMVIRHAGTISAGTFVMGKNGLQLIFAVLLLALGVVVAFSGFKKLVEKPAAG